MNAVGQSPELEKVRPASPSSEGGRTGGPPGPKGGWAEDLLFLLSPLKREMGT